MRAIDPDMEPDEDDEDDEENEDDPDDEEDDDEDGGEKWYVAGLKPPCTQTQAGA